MSSWMKRPRNIVGPVIKELREKMGFSQPQLAAKINLLGWDLSRDIIARIECQTRWVADSEILILAESLKIDGPELLRLAVLRNKKR